MAAGDYILRLGHLTGLSMSDIDGDDATPRSRPGTLAFVVDAFGYKVLRYGYFVNAMLRGELCSRYGGVNGTTVITNQTGTSATSVTTTGLTANAHRGAIIYVHDDTGAAGAAPEGEMSVAASNTTTVITLEDDLPFTVALASGDDVTSISTYAVEDSADGDLAVTCQGIVMGAQGVTASQYGWYLMEGIVKALSTAESITTFNPVVAAANTVDEFGTDGQELWVGTALATYTSDNVATTLPVRMNLFAPAGVGLSP